MRELSKGELQASKVTGKNGWDYKVYGKAKLPI
jgi:hypothetical protein